MFAKLKKFYQRHPKDWKGEDIKHITMWRFNRVMTTIVLGMVLLSIILTLILGSSPEGVAAMESMLKRLHIVLVI